MKNRVRPQQVRGHRLLTHHAFLSRDESALKASFMQNLIEDRTESALSYYEFLLHLQQQVSK